MKLTDKINELTRFERGLWGGSVLVVIASFLCASNKDVWSLIASLIGVSALIFVARGDVLGQILTVVFAIFYGVISYWFHYYGEMITYLGMTAPMALMAVISWIRNPYQDTKQVKINSLKSWHWICLVILTIIVTIGFYFILKACNNANLSWSTASIATSFFASALTFLRSPYYALAYAANDVILIVLWILACMIDISYLPMCACFTMFLLNDSYGFYNWNRMKKQQMSK